MAVEVWRVPPMWQGERVFVLGGGPSLRDFDVSRLRGRGRVLAINNAFEIAPFADLLFAADARWFDWNRSTVGDFKQIIATRQQLDNREWVNGIAIRRLEWDRAAALSLDPGRVAGFCSGANSINLSWLAGAAEIFLLGFDMRPGQWHGKHKVASKDEYYRERMIPSLNRMAVALRAAGGGKVFNATPGSALEAFPKVDIEARL